MLVNFKFGQDHGYESLFGCHRLDRLTSGIVIFAKTKHFANKIITEIRERKVRQVLFFTYASETLWHHCLFFETYSHKSNKSARNKRGSTNFYRSQSTCTLFSVSIVGFRTNSLSETLHACKWPS